MTRHQLIGWLLLASALDLAVQGDPTYLSKLTDHWTPWFGVALAATGAALVSGSELALKSAAVVIGGYVPALALTLSSVYLSVPWGLSAPMREQLSDDVTSTLFIQLALVIGAGVVLVVDTRSKSGKRSAEPATG